MQRHRPVFHFCFFWNRIDGRSGIRDLGSGFRISFNTIFIVLLKIRKILFLFRYQKVLRSAFQTGYLQQPGYAVELSSDAFYQTTAMVCPQIVLWQKWLLCIRKLCTQRPVINPHTRTILFNNHLLNLSANQCMIFLQPTVDDRLNAQNSSRSSSHNIPSVLQNSCIDLLERRLKTF